MQQLPTIQALENYSKKLLKVEILRLDLVHPIISGNKWYKLKHHLMKAKAQNASQIVSFGGPYSNHIVALAHAAKLQSLKSIGYIRANEGEPITPSMQQAIDDGMEMHFIGRTNFQESKQLYLAGNNTQTQTYYVDEGGYGKLGAMGITDLYKALPLHQYDYILCAVGTGTMLAGFMNGAKAHQHIIGIPVLKNEGTIESEIRNLLIDIKQDFVLLHSFHQGGYAKTTPEQLDSMNAFWESTQVPTDIVYTGKLIFAFEQLIKDNYFKPNAKVLLIHSGGLQGNRSLPKGVLLY